MNASGNSPVGIFIFVLIVTVIVIMIAYSCKRPNHHTPRTFPGLELWTTNLAVAMEVEDPTSNRLDRATLMSYPKLLYTEAKLRHNDTTATCCSICLADYKDDEVLRLLPECEHLFHLKCVDPWLLLHPTCPVCRTSPLPSPAATPLAEVAPLAASM